VNRVPRTLTRIGVHREDHDLHPVLIGNSLPKSGTHLLMQILEAFPGARNFGTFIAKAPSISFLPRSDAYLAKLLNQAVPGEILGAHLTYSPLLVDAAMRTNSCHYFIYRDPRDVVISNAHYMQNKNIWNRLHRVAARKFPSFEDKITMLLTGFDKDEGGFDYPDLRRRIEPFVPWIDHPSVCAVRFEDLALENQDATIRRMVHHFCARRNGGDEEGDLVAAAKTAIAPNRSHTFRSGRSGEWRRHFTARHKELMKEIAGDLLIQLGYERDHGW
jgi:hypothetical protein